MVATTTVAFWVDALIRRVDAGVYYGACDTRDPATWTMPGSSELFRLLVGRTRFFRALLSHPFHVLLYVGYVVSCRCVSYHRPSAWVLYMYVCFACQGLDEEHMSRLKGRRAALLAAREAREKGGDSEDFIALDGKVSLINQ